MRAIFVHGAGGGAWEWRVWEAVFQAEGIFTVALEWVPSALGLAHTDYAHYRTQLVAACHDARAADSFVLIGASLGGLLAMDVAAAVKPQALVLINPMPPKGVAPELVPESREPAIRPWGTMRDFASTKRALFDVDEASVHVAHTHWRDESGLVLQTAWDGIEVSPFQAPCLVLASELDDSVPASVSARIARDFNASLIQVPGASHVGPLLGQSAAHCAQLCVTWLKLNTGQHHPNNSE